MKNAGTLRDVLVSLMLGLGVGVVVSAGAAAGDDKSASTTQEADVGEVTMYPKNSKGHTYGSAADAPRPDLEPELIAVMTSDGKTGWARKADLDGRMPATPAEAVRQNESGPRTIPVFDVEEERVIGTFKISAGKGGAGQPPRASMEP